MPNSYRQLKLAVILYQANNQGGAWRSIMTYFRHAEMQGDSVKLINRAERRTFRQVVAAAIAAPRLLINGLGSFQRWEAIILCLLRRDSLIYLHETAYMLDQFQRTFPLRYRFVKRILKYNPVLAVSEQAAEQYRERFGSKSVFVTYECLPARPQPLPSDGIKRICMVGTIDERKGATFFSRLADLAKEKDLPWEFHWIGSKGSREQSYLSENVKWWGWLDNPREFVKRCDLFFLASVDDPFPLACLEALQDHVRAVAFAKTGVSEVLGGLTGCAIFQEYQPDAALAAMTTAMNAELDPVQIDQLMTRQIEVSAFRKRLDRIISTVREVSDSPARNTSSKDLQKPIPALSQDRHPETTNADRK